MLANRIDTPFYFLIRARNAFEFFDRCINSIFAQKNKKYTIIYIDDASEVTLLQKKYIRQRLKNHIVQFNRIRKYSVRNAYEAIHKHVPDDAIVISLDGDDWLSRKDALDTIHATYANKRCDFTYGNCMYFNPGGVHHRKAATEVHPFANRRYPKGMEQLKSYRFDHFRSLHIKTWKAKKFKVIPKSRFLFPDGSWIRFCEDQAIAYPMLEASKGAYEVINILLSVYNISHPSSDDVQYGVEKIADEVAIRRYARDVNQRVIKCVRSIRDEQKAIFYINYSIWTHGLIGSGYLIYQILIVLCGFTRTLYLGGQNRLLERLLIRAAEYTSDKFIVRSYNAGFSLSQCVHPILLDTVWNQKKLSIRQREMTMWCLTFAREMTAYCLGELTSIGIPLKKFGLVWFET